MASAESAEPLEDAAAAEKRPQPQGKQTPATEVNFRWTSRNNRKGRHQLVARLAEDASNTKYLVPEKTSSPKIVLGTIGKMLTNYPYWNISWLVAYVFTWGSILWVWFS
jgi:hypothetical protein